MTFPIGTGTPRVPGRRPAAVFLAAVGGVVSVLLLASCGSPRPDLASQAEPVGPTVSSSSSAAFVQTASTGTGSVAPSSNAQPPTAQPPTAQPPTAQPPTRPPTEPAPPPLSTCGAPANPYDYNFCGRGGYVYRPQLPGDVCSYFSCIDSFRDGKGYLVQCADGMFSMSGGRSGVCSHHGGMRRPSAVAQADSPAPHQRRGPVPG